MKKIKFNLELFLKITKETGYKFDDAMFFFGLVKLMETGITEEEYNKIIKKSNKK